MITKISRLGDSYAILFSKEMIEASGFRTDQDLELTIIPGQITITSARSHLTLKERIHKYGPVRSFPEMDWGEPIGNEKW